MEIIKEKEGGKILELFENDAQKNAYYLEIICNKDLDKMRKARIEIDKRIDKLAEAEIQRYRDKALSAEKALVYSLGKKTTDLQKGLYFALVELQPVASFNYESDIQKLKEKYNIEDQTK